MIAYLNYSAPSITMPNGRIHIYIYICINNIRGSSVGTVLAVVVIVKVVKLNIHGNEVISRRKTK